jgi:hypothetical protein
MAKQEKPMGILETYNPGALLKGLDPTKDKDMISFMSERANEAAKIVGYLSDPEKLYTENGVKNLYTAADSLKAILDKYANVDKTRSAAKAERGPLNELYKGAEIIYAASLTNIGALESVAKLNAQLKAEEAAKAKSESEQSAKAAEKTAGSLADLKKYHDGRNKGK